MQNRVQAARTCALWFPDWPVHAADLEPPAAVVEDRRIAACDEAARGHGVHRAMRVREAQALCPRLHVAAFDPERDARAFERISQGLDEVAAAIEVLRPGLVAVALRGPAGYFGGEEVAIEKLIDAAARRGVDCMAGAADDVPTAILAARKGVVVPCGGSRAFLSSLPLRALGAETALGCDTAVIDTIGELGVRTLGELADLPAAAVTTRFGRAGLRCHELARGADTTAVMADTPAAELAVAAEPEEPITRVDVAAFAARGLATRLHSRLATQGLAMNRLRIIADFSSGAQLVRIWRTREALTEQATADRVRWQLDGWLTANGQAAGGVTRITLEPLSVAAPREPEALWGQSRGRPAARAAIERVASQLGADNVLQPHLRGERGVADRIEMLPYGEAHEPEPTGTWPGRIPGPLPARLGPGLNHPASRIRIIDAAGEAVAVNREAELTAAPAWVYWGATAYRVTGWAGPWPVARPHPMARLQIVAEADGELGAWLVVWHRGSWRIEARYA